jgi:peroxiredoxin
MRRLFGISAAFFVLFAFSGSDAVAQLSMGIAAPGFSLRDAENKVVSLSDYDGEAVLVYFFGYNCPYCIDEAPYVETKIWQRFQDRDFQVLAVDVWNGSVTEIQTFFQGPTGVTFPVLRNGEAVGRDFKVSHDWYVLLDRDHNVYLSVAGSYHNRKSANTVVDDLAAEVNTFLAASTDGPSEPESLPSAFRLEQNYPNPFNPSTNIAFRLGERARVELSVYNLAGNRVRELVDGFRGPGDYTVVWDGGDDSGRRVPSGIYFYRLAATGLDGTAYVETRRMALTK